MLTLLIWTNSLINYYLFVFCFVLFFNYKSVKLNVFIVITKKLLIGASETAFLGSLSCYIRVYLSFKAGHQELGWQMPRSVLLSVLAVFFLFLRV